MRYLISLFIPFYKYLGNRLIYYYGKGRVLVEMSKDLISNLSSATYRVCLLGHFMSLL